MYVCLPRMHVCVHVSVCLCVHSVYIYAYPWCLHVGEHVCVNVHAHAYGGQVLEMRVFLEHSSTVIIDAGSPN